MDLYKKELIAHRGASGLVKYGNTIESFEKAIEVGASIIEFDIRKSKDNVIICFHDRHINGKLIKSLNYNEIEDIANSKGFSVPTLEETIKFCKGKAILDIEFKEMGYEKEVISLVLNYLNYNEFFMKSFKDKCVINIQNIDSNIITGILIGERIRYNTLYKIVTNIFPYFRIKKTGPNFIAVNYRLLTLGYIFRIKLIHKIPVFAWTINDKKNIDKCFRKGVSKVITNFPNIDI